MQFTFPTAPDILYRLERLRRLIAVGAGLSLLIYAIIRIIEGFIFGQFSAAILPVGLACLIVTAAHSVMFPNLMSETLMVPIALVVLIIAAPLAGGSVLGWILGWPVLLIAVAIFAVIGQGRILNWQLAGRRSPATLRETITVKASAADALAAFAGRPKRENDHEKSGSADAKGFFPVLIKSTQSDLWGDLDAEIYNDMDIDAKEAFDDQIEALKEDAGFEDLHGFEMPEPHPDLGALPSYWLQIVEQTEIYQKANVFMPAPPGEDLQQHAVIEHRATAKGARCVVEEVETVQALEAGARLGLWLTDYQMDGLVMSADALEGRAPRALRLQHQSGLLTLLGQAFVRRQLNNRREDID